MNECALFDCMSTKQMIRKQIWIKDRSAFSDREIMRLLAVDHTKMFELQADARYTPLTESDKAVTAPTQSGSVNVETCVQSLREMVIISDIQNSTTCVSVLQ